MAKKFKELKKGDFIYYIEKSRLSDGVQKDVLCKDVYEKGDEYHIEVIKSVSHICIPKSSVSKDVSSQLYCIYGTTQETVLDAARKFIDKGVASLDKIISETEEKLKYYKMHRKMLLSLVK